MNWFDNRCFLFICGIADLNIEQDTEFHRILAIIFTTDELLVASLHAFQLEKDCSSSSTTTAAGGGRGGGSGGGSGATVFSSFAGGVAEVVPRNDEKKSSVVEGTLSLTAVDAEMDDQVRWSMNTNKRTNRLILRARSAIFDIKDLI